MSMNTQSKKSGIEQIKITKLDTEIEIGQSIDKYLPSEVSSLNSDAEAADGEGYSSSDNCLEEINEDEDSGNYSSLENPNSNTDKKEDDNFSAKNVRGRPSACVFVASLAAALSDDDLCLSVTGYFKKFGKLTNVKVLRDQENRPYAFVQYTNDNDANKALKEAHGSRLNGRIIRCEHAKVNRTLYIVCKPSISFSELETLCAKFGEIEQLIPSRDSKPTNPKYSFNFSTKSTSWFIRFVYRDDAIRAFANLKTEFNWNVQWAQNVTVPKKFNLVYRKKLLNENDLKNGKKTGLRNSNVENNNDIENNNDDEANANIEFETSSEVESENSFEVTIDKESIFVGQLHPDTNEENLKEHFSVYGKIVDINLIHKPTNVFAFIQYDSEMAAAAALEKENHSIFLNKTIHVQYKEIGGFHGRKPFRKLSNPINNFNGPQLNLAPPPISTYRRRSHDPGHMSASNPQHGGPIPLMPYMTPNMPGIPTFDPNFYSNYMHGIPSYRRSSVPDNWGSYRNNNKNPDGQNNIANHNGGDSPTDFQSELPDSAGQLGNSTTTYNDSSPSNENTYKKKHDKFNYNESINPYYFSPHYYYPPVHYPLAPTHSSQGSQQPYMMVYSMPPPSHGDPSLIPINGPMELNDGMVSGPNPQMANFATISPGKPNKLMKKGQEYLDY